MKTPPAHERGRRYHPKERSMPHQNRVTPFGDIIAVAAKGALMGNRGVLHADDGRLVHPWRTEAWITCALEFKGRSFPVRAPGHCTALFFHDEATALAAGHRPCAMCRRAHFNAFRDAWARGNGWDGLSPPRTRDIDIRLHAERVEPHTRRKTVYEATAGDLPDGTMIAFPDDPARAWLLSGGLAHPWSPEGYGAPRPLAREVPVTVQTPRSTVNAIAAGYRPVLTLPTVL